MFPQILFKTNYSYSYHQPSNKDLFGQYLALKTTQSYHWSKTFGKY